MHPRILYLSSMLTIALLASSNLLNVGSALPSEQDVPGGEEGISERDSIGKSLMLYQSLTTHAGILARAAENHIAPSPGNDYSGNMTSNLRIVYHTWSMFVPSADAARSLSQMYRACYAAALNESASVAPPVRVAFTYGAFTLTLIALARVIPWDVVIAVLRYMMAGVVFYGFCSVFHTVFGVVWIVLAAVELTYVVRQSLDAMLDGLNKR